MSTTSVDLADFYAEQKTRNAPCSVGRALMSLPPEEAERLRMALATSARVLQHQAIDSWLEKHGHPQGKGAVSRHRRKVCHCE